MKYSFELYVTGKGPRTQRVLANLERLVAELDLPSEFDVIDLLEQPDAAEREGVVVTPMLVKTAPLPRARVFGDLSEVDRTVAVLGLRRRP